ncbi:MAG: hypothetical protein IIZ17_08135 [Eubacteriaceae bacterium]|nr:hypothetical protein [Eubacteriaceae bacterium]
MDTLEVLENGEKIIYTYEDLLKYHGYFYPGGVAHAFKVMQRAFPLLDDGKLLERRDLSLVTAFLGPGGLDAFEMVTRCISTGKCCADKYLPEAQDSLESPHGRYYFRFSYRGKTVAVTIMPGFVRDEFIHLARKKDLTDDEAVKLAEMKKEMADRLLSLPAEEIYKAVIL